MDMQNGITILHGHIKTLLLCVVAILSVFSSCVTSRRCLEKFPPVVTVDTVETILIVDTTIYVQLPADTVIKEMPVEVEPDYSSDIAVARGEYATARAWIANRSLHVQLTTNDTLIAWRIDSLALVNTKTITVEKERIVEVKKIPEFYKALPYIAGFLLLLVLFMFYLAVKR